MVNLKSKDYTNDEKMKYANREINKFLKDNFQLTGDIPYSENSRLRTTIGRIISKRYTVPYGRYNGSNRFEYRESRIEYNSKFLEEATLEEVAAIGKHEALHYACMQLNKPSNDGDAYFEAQLRKYGLPSHRDMRTVGETVNKVTQVYTEADRHYAICTKCGKVVAVWKRKPQVNKFGKYASRCCRQSIKYMGKIPKDKLDNLITK